MGLKKNNPGCQCCLIEPPDCPCRRMFMTAPVGTPTSREMPSYYDISIAGLTNDNCASCNDWNGDFELCWCDTHNAWCSTPSSSTACGHASGDPLWRLEYLGGGPSYKVTALGINLSWSLTSSSWLPWGTNTLAADTPPSPNPCGGIPSTIDVVACTTPCTGCSAPVPQTVSVTLAGWTGYQCLCDDINDTYVLQEQYATIDWRCSFAQVFDIGCGPGTWLSNWLTVIARVVEDPWKLTFPKNLGWHVTTEYNIQYYGYPYIPQPISGIIRGQWWWDSGDVVAFDCTATHALTLKQENYTFTNRPCGVLGGTTCQIN